MKLYFLLFFKTLLIFNTSESPLNRTDRFNDSVYGNSSSSNSRYNEVLPTNDRNQNQFNTRQISRNYSKQGNTHSHEASDQNSRSLQPPVPAVTTLELKPQLYPNSHFPINNVHIPKSDDRIIFPDDPTFVFNQSNYSKDENSCFSVSKVFYNDSCLELLKECGEGKWLVLDLESALKNPPRIKPTCSEKKCKSDEFFWPKTNLCYNNSEIPKDFCPRGNTVTNDYFGHGTCVCAELNGLFNNGTCYPLYTRGPCLNGYLFVEKSGKTECVKNPCRNSSLAPYYKEGNRSCYELGKQGPCEPNYTFHVSKETKEPDCNNNVAPLIIVNPPKFCSSGVATKDCPPQIKVENPQKYIDRIIEHANKRNG